MEKRVTLLLLICSALRSHGKSPAHTEAELDSHLRALLVSIDPNQDPQTVHHDGNLAIRSPDLAADDVRIRKQKSGCTLPEQVRGVLRNSDCCSRCLLSVETAMYVQSSGSCL